MVNFIRAEGRAVGRWPPDLSSRDAFQSEHWLMPQLEDDALLYSLHDIVGDDLDNELNGVTIGPGQIGTAQPQRRDYILSEDPRPDNPKYRIAEMERKVINAQRELIKVKQLLAMDMQLHGQWNHVLTGEEAAFKLRNDVQQSGIPNRKMGLNGSAPKLSGDVDSNYFDSYSSYGERHFDPASLPNAHKDRHP